MIAIHQLENVPSSTHPLSLALGNFDGLHIGHAAVIQSAVKIAQQKKAKRGYSRSIRIPVASSILKLHPRFSALDLNKMICSKNCTSGGHPSTL